jgi:Ca-activated chloride channel family protein
MMGGMGGVTDSKGAGMASSDKSIFSHDGDAAGSQIDGATIDNFIAEDDDGDQRPVAIFTGEPIVSTKPELTLPSQPMRDASSTFDMPALELLNEGTESHIVSDTESNERPDSSFRVKAHIKDGANFTKLDELGVKDYQVVREKAKPSVSPYSKVVEYSWQGDVSKEKEEVSIDDGEVTPAPGTEKYITELLEPTDEIESPLTKAHSADSDSLSPMGGEVEKEERRRRTILGDIPITGGLFGHDGKKRPLSMEEEERIVNYLKEKQITEGLEPEGGSVTAAMPTKPDPNLDYDEPSAVDRTGILPGEDEPDLPPALRFKLVPVNPWVMTERDSLSTFALDVDTASYTLCRRYIRGGFLPPAGAVRMEEFVNYFNYNYPQRTNPTFMVHTEAAASPFAGKDKNLTLLKIGVKARTIGRDQRKAAHLIFVVDTSASMGQPDRLPFVQQALDLLVNKLSVVDRVSLITCANEARLHLESIPAREHERIRQAIYAIQSAGATNLLAGLKLGYATARRSFAPKQINHVVLCSDGVANVGQTEAEAVLEEVAADRKQGITITCVGVGYGSYNDAFLEALANRGDGSYVFLDSARETQQVFIKQLAATLQTVAKDARIQVDFNPHRVRRYRLIGYENRDIEDNRFRDDSIDAGEVGSGQCSTALYELELIGQPSADRQGDLGIVFVRYRDVETGQIEEISSRLSSAVVRRHTVASAPRFFLAAGAARFAEILRQSEHVEHGNLTDVFRLAEQVSLALPLDRDVRELVELIRKTEHLPRAP